jgi:HK97 family phage major capsid protein
LLVGRRLLTDRRETAERIAVTRRIPSEGSKDMAGKTIAEHLVSLKATRDAAQKKLDEVLQKSIDESRSMDSAERAEVDSLKAQIKTLDQDIATFSERETLAAQGAKSVADAAAAAAASVTNGAASVSTLQIRNTEKVDKGIGFARVARCVALSYMRHEPAESIAKALYPDDPRTLAALQKANVPAASTTSATWGGNLINEGGIAFADFVEYLRPRTLLGQISDRLRRLPFDTPVLVQGSGGTARWVGEGKAKPLTSWTYTRTKLAPLKVAAIAAITKELLMRSGPVADALIRDELARSIGAGIDTTFISDAAAVANESPAGILNGVSALTLSGGSTVADIRCDIATFLTSMADANLSLAGTFWVMPERIAIALSLIVNEVGASAFPGITPNGGTFAGLPVFVTSYADTDSDGSVVALMKGDEIFLGDEDGIQVAMSDQASLIMTDDANSGTNHTSTGPNPSTVVSMFQTNSVAVLVERFLNFQRRRTQAVAWARVTWSACTGS